MRLLMSVRLPAIMVLMLAAALAAGCARDREQELIGRWKGSALNATFKAIKMKEDTGASQKEAEEAAKIMAATFVELKSDKTFTAGMGGATTEGNWTFNKETGEAVLNITAMKGPDGQPVESAPTAWTAILDDDNRRLGFYPAPPESVAMIRESKVKGGFTSGVSLYKR